MIVGQGLGPDADFYPPTMIFYEIRDDAGNVGLVQAADGAAKDLGVIIIGCDSQSPRWTCANTHNSLMGGRVTDAFVMFTLNALLRCRPCVPIFCV